MDSSGASSRRSKNIRMTRSFVSWSYLVRMPHSLLSRGRRASIKARAVQSARSRLELVSLIERLRRVGLPVAVACAVAGVSRASYYRWRYRLRRGGARALTDGRSRNRRRRAAPVRSAVRPLVQQLRRERPMGKEKLALTLAAHGVTVSASTVGRCITELVSRGVIEAIGAARRGQRARRL